jgi:hypothetical protein
MWCQIKVIKLHYKQKLSRPETQTVVTDLGFMWIAVVILGFKWDSVHNFKSSGETYPNKIYPGLRTYPSLGTSILKIICKVMNRYIFFKNIYLWIFIWLGYIDFEKINKYYIYIYIYYSYPTGLSFILCLPYVYPIHKLYINPNLYNLCLQLRFIGKWRKTTSCEVSIVNMNIWYNSEVGIANMNIW